MLWSSNIFHCSKHYSMYVLLCLELDKKVSRPTLFTKNYYLGLLGITFKIVTLYNNTGLSAFLGLLKCDFESFCILVWHILWFALDHCSHVKFSTYIFSFRKMAKSTSSFRSQIWRVDGVILFLVRNSCMEKAKWQSGWLWSRQFFTCHILHRSGHSFAICSPSDALKPGSRTLSCLVPKSWFIMIGLIFVREKKSFVLIVLNCFKNKWWCCHHHLFLECFDIILHVFKKPHIGIKFILYYTCESLVNVSD